MATRIVKIIVEVHDETTDMITPEWVSEVRAALLAADIPATVALAR